MKKEAKIIVVANQKGGVGKTTTAHILSNELSNRGYKCLAIDLDPQTNLTTTLMSVNEEKNIYRLLKGEAALDEVIHKVNENLDVISSSIMLSNANHEFLTLGGEMLLREKVVNKVRENYDYIVIDTPPTLSILTSNAMLCANSVIIPMTVEAYSMQGFSQLYENIQLVKKYYNKDIKIDGVLFTKIDGRSNKYKEFEAVFLGLANHLGVKVFENKIHIASIIDEAQKHKEDIMKKYKKSAAAVSYSKFVDEYIS